MITPVVPAGVLTLLQFTKAGTVSLTVPVNRIYYLAWASLKYVASADVGDRVARIQVMLTDAATLVTLAVASAAASQTRSATYNVAAGEVTLDSTSADSGTGMLFPLYPGMKLQVNVTGGFAAGDTWVLEGLYYEVPISCP